MAGCWINLASYSCGGWEEVIGLSWANRSEGFQVNVKHKRLIQKVYSHWLKTVQFPLHALGSCDRPNYLKLFYVINTKFSLTSFHHSARPVDSPWRWRQHVALEHLNFTWCENHKHDHCLINNCHKSLETYIVTVFISVRFSVTCTLKCLNVLIVNTES